ncbi:hypothetical protein [Brevundimonas denitrificans]|uniref:hypothetical protein n=1 Tax=Brevundimonas denitrificans TaxID=1443434 RepID=UPI00352F1AF6
MAGVRAGIYWLKAPEYLRRNHLDADRALPWFFWSGETDMACVADAVTQARSHAYAHHIQRLMVTGNLAMLLGVHPGRGGRLVHGGLRRRL